MTPDLVVIKGWSIRDCWEEIFAKPSIRVPDPAGGWS